jgi:hypothetical protein
MAEEHEIHAKLTLDDAAGAALEHIKGGFEHVGEKAREVQHELGAMLRQTLATAAGFQLSGMVDTMKEFGHEVFAAATESEEQVKSLAGLIAMTDKTGMSFEDTTERASDLKDSLENIGIEAGVSADAVIDAFETIAVRSQKSTVEIREMTEQMTTAGRALPGGVQTLAAAYRDLESGIVRPRNAVVQLIRQTGTAHGTAKEIAKSLSGMVQAGHMDKAFDLANIAIGKMNDKMKNAPLSFKEVVQSMKDIRNNIFESMGLPLLKAITPQLERLRTVLLDHREGIEEFAAAASVKVGTWVSYAANKIAEGFKYIQAHADQIEKAFTRGAEVVKKTFDFIIAHKEGIGVALGAKTVGSAGMSLAGPGIMALIKGAVGGGGAMAGGEAGLLAALGPELIYVLPLVIGAMLGLEGAFHNITDSTAAFHSESVKLWKRIQEDFAAIVGDLHAGYVDLIPTIQFVADVMGHELLVSIRMVTMSIRGTIDMFKGLNEAIQWILDKTGIKLKTPALTDTGQGWEPLNRAAAEIPKGLVLATAKMDVSRMPAPNFNIGTVNIKQDFRDQDPDRIAVIFRQDLAKNATNAMGAKTNGSPFGAL